MRWFGEVPACRAAILVVLCLLTARMPGANAQAVWQPSRFPIAFWCGPPEPFITQEQYVRIRDAGFSVILPPCEGAVTVERNRKILDTARATGLKVILADSRMPLELAGKPEAEKALKDIVADYHRHPALLGYFLTDEPGADRFAGLAEVAAELHKLDPAHLVYINLFPNVATNDRIAQPSQLRTNTYDDYLDRFMQTVKPDILSWDHYHFLKDSDGAGYFGNLAAGQRAALSTEPPTPFWQIVLSVQHGPYRALTENELRFEAMQTLVYGASGLVYFTYWLPPDDASFKWSHAIMARDGTPGPLYEAVKKVNQEVRTLTKWLYPGRVLRTFQTGDVPPDGTPPPNDVPIRVTGAGNLSVGTFRVGAGYFCILLTNRDYRARVSTTVQLNAGTHVVELLDIASNKWRPAKGETTSEGDTILKIELDPAGAALLRWQ